jgi:RHS repeat-associated protein
MRVTGKAIDELSTDTYDLNGNTLATGGKAFTYDSENELKTMNGGAVALFYDGDGNRVAKTANGVTTYFLVDDLNPTGLPQVVEELASNGTVARQYTYGLERISENQIVNGAWTASFYESDGAGSVRQLTNSAGVVIDSYEYDAFGNKVNSTGTTPNNYLYRGEQYDPDLSLYYLRARYYNPVTGRFLSVDPEAGDGQRRYEYAGADPVNGMDPSGNEAIIEFALLQFYPGRLNIHFPDWCRLFAGGLLPGCQAGTGGGPKGPGGPPPPPQKKVKVCWRSLLKARISNSIPNPILGHFKHTYVEIDSSDGTQETWGVLGVDAAGSNQEVIKNDPRNSPFGGSGCKDVPCSDSAATFFESALNATIYPGSTCPSCGAAYRNWWWRQPPDGFNSNTYTYNMVYNFLFASPSLPVVAPGFHFSGAYSTYF